MAFGSSDYFYSAGLNIISSLDLSLDSCPSNTLLLPRDTSITSTSLYSDHSLSCNDMSDSSKSKSSGGGFGSRIPKINFGFRKQSKNVATVSSTNGSDNGSCSERSTPEGCEGTPPPSRAAGTKKQAPGSNNSSPNIGRSKSLRLPRSTYIKYTARSNVDMVRDEAEDYYPDDLVDSGGSGDGSSSEQPIRLQVSKTGQTGLVKSGRPRSSTVSSAASRSRSISPGGLMMTTGGANGVMDTSRFGFHGGSLSQTDTNEDCQESADGPSNFSRRSHSFSAKHQTRVRAGSVGPQNRLQPPQAGSGARQPFRRSKTPTALSQRTAQTSQTGQTGSKNGTSKLGLSRTSSLGKVKQQSTGIGSVQTRHATTSDHQRVRKSSADTRGKRPSSEVILESATADLNAIAQELSQGDVGGPEVKTISGRTRPSSAKNLSSGKRSNSAIGFNKTFNPRCDTPEQQAPPTSAVAPPPSAASGKTKLLSAGGRQGSGDKSNRPTSAREHYHQHRRNESVGSGGSLEPPIMETRLERSHSAANFEAQGGNMAHSIIQRKSSGGGRSSAPSSGRSTPVQRSMSGSKSGKDVTDGGVVSTGKVGTGLPPRTPYKVARTKATPTSGPTGINELEGSVLLEADDYRRISNEVKSIKTALLKLKREIQADFEGKTPSSQPNQTPRSAAVTPVRVGRSVTSPASTPGPAHSDLRKKLKAVTSERDKALDEVGSCKKELKVKTGKIESLMAELEAEKLKNKELASELEQVESQRNRLLDKVERLHADKHNLEARLNTLERASVYEQTFSESWLDEGEYDDDLDIMDPALGGDGSVKGMTAAERKEMTESEIGDLIQSDGGEGESSEPESSAVCSVPVS